MYLHSLIDPSCRVAFAAFLHDLGKLAQRAQLFDADPAREVNQQLYCPHRRAHERDPGYFTHLHAADTAIALDALERHLPELLADDPFPFAHRGSSDVTDSLVNAAAAHHKPETFLQWVVASADRIASGFERENWDTYNASKDREDFRKARLLVRFEEARRDKREEAEADLRFRYPLELLSAAALMPMPEPKATPAREEAVRQYRALWDGLMPGEGENRGVGLIPKSHRACWPLWLDHFDTLWLTVAHAIPSATAFGTRPDVSLYDHSKTTAALAVALWRYHHEREDDKAEVAGRLKARSDWEEAKFLLVQGDFSGIQNFVFGGAAETQKKAARLLRGRSAMVALLTELAALRLLEELGLPATSQIINAAGRFLIVAPNTEGAREAVNRVRDALDQWFVSNLFGLTGIAIAVTEASAADFTEGGKEAWRFSVVLDRLRGALEVEKRRLFAGADGVLDADFSAEACRFDGRLPAAEGCMVGDDPAHPLSKDAIDLGQALADRERARLLVFRVEAAGQVSGLLMSDFFGYRVLLTQDKEAKGNFGAFAGDGRLVRAFDIAMPGAVGDAVCWQGYARRAISAFVPVHDHEPSADTRYDGIESDGGRGSPKTFEHLAVDDRAIEADDGVRGVSALGVLKGDIDDLGALFQDTMGAKPTFAKWAEMSRRVNAFFTHWVPHRLAADPAFRNVYTVFAGGDDFVFIGPWRTTRKFARALRHDFHRYVAKNDAIHFSAGYAMVKPGHPVRQMLHEAEEALERAKARDGALGKKNALALYGSVIAWTAWDTAVEKPIEALEAHLVEDDPSSGYLYGLLHLAEMARKVGERPENARWRSRLFYQTRRFTERTRGMEMHEQEDRAMALVSEFGVKGIEQNADGFRVALFDQLYARRK